MVLLVVNSFIQTSKKHLFTEKGKKENEASLKTLYTNYTYFVPAFFGPIH